MLKTLFKPVTLPQTSFRPCLTASLLLASHPCKNLYIGNTDRELKPHKLTPMPGVKTAISLDEKLFKRVNKLAQEMRVSRSRLFTLAVTDYLKKQENLVILAQLNKAYGNQPNERYQKKDLMKYLMVLSCLPSPEKFKFAPTKHQKNPLIE